MFLNVSNKNADGKQMHMHWKNRIGVCTEQDHLSVNSIYYSLNFLNVFISSKQFSKLVFYLEFIISNKKENTLN